ncbi:MAG: glycosyltransferase family 4 protein [Planctomycetes bacterium]|nr:glycosyltransferase family 4 protein [Planctomycetota bacterium]
MPRLLALSWCPLWPLRGGAAARGHALLSRLAARGWRVWLVAPAPLPPGLDGPAGPSPRARQWAGMRGQRWRRFLPNPDVLSAFRPAPRRRAVAVGRGFRPDAVLALGVWSCGHARAAAAAAGGAPLFLDLSHVEAATIRESRGRGVAARVAAAIVRTIERRALAATTAAFVVSEEDRARLAALYPESAAKARVLPNGVDLPREVEVDAPRADPAPFRVLFVGRMSYSPNREAAEFLARRVAPIWTGGEIAMAGEAPPAGVAASVRVRLLGAPDSLAEHYARASAVCAPIFTGTGTRLKVLEAAAHRRPIVATPRAVEGLGFEPGVHYLPAWTAPAFAAAFERLRHDPVLANSLARNARMLVETLTWDRIGAQADATLRAVVRLFD